MAAPCKSCYSTEVGNYCIECGQKKYKRIDKTYVLDEIKYVAFHMNKGLLYTLKKLIKNPGATARDYIDGNRVHHYKPLLLLFLLSSISAFLSYKVLKFHKIILASNTNKYMKTPMMADYMTAISNYSTLIMMLLVPLFAITTKIAFKKLQNNYYEHVVMNSYILSYYTLISILVLYPIMFIFKNTHPQVLINISSYSMLFIPVLLVWFFKGYYPQLTLKKVIINVLAILGMVALGYLLLIILVTIGMVILMVVKGIKPDMYMKPK